MIEELINRVFWTRNLCHVTHWGTESYAQHMALGSFYEDIIGALDSIVEAYQGRYAKVKPYVEDNQVPDDLIAHLEEEADWIATNRCTIARDCATIENMIDTLAGTYLATLYKLKELR